MALTTLRSTAGSRSLRVGNAARPRSVKLCVRASMVESSGAVSAFPNHVVLKHDMSKEKLEKKGVFSWPTWGCEVGKFPWYYQENEDAYILEGRVIVTPEFGEPVEIKAGDFATFPVGMNCEWDVKEAIRKHYRFH